MIFYPYVQYTELFRLYPDLKITVDKNWLNRK